MFTLTWKQKLEYWAKYLKLTLTKDNHNEKTDKERNKKKKKRNGKN